MNPLDQLAAEVPHLQHSFDPVFVFGSGSFGMTQYVLWMIICFVITLIVVLTAGKRLTLIPTNKFTNMVEYGYEFVKKDMGESAIGHGYKAAYGIDCYLKGKEPVDHPKKEIATFESLNTWYYSDAPKTVRPMLDLVRRQSTFDEVQHGLTEENALFEARRCMSCGNCLQCDNCYGVCPDNAVIKTGDDNVPYIFNYDYCKGCGVCASECPCGAIKMEPESI